MLFFFPPPPQKVRVDRARNCKKLLKLLPGQREVFESSREPRESETQLQLHFGVRYNFRQHSKQFIDCRLRKRTSMYPFVERENEAKRITAREDVSRPDVLLQRRTRAQKKMAVALIEKTM